MESIGTRLKKAREGKGISLEQAQKDTLIHNKVLASFEDDRPQEAISGTVYIKNFIKKYGNYLGLDGASLAEEYKGEEVLPRIKATTGEKSNAAFVFPVKKVITAAIIIIAVFAGIKLMIFAGSKISEGLKSRPKAVKKVKSQRPKPRAAIKEAPEKVSRQAAAPVPKGENISLKIKAKSSIYLKIKADGSVIYDGILKKGATETWEAKDSIDISTGRAESIDAELNGKSLGVLGKGVTKGILITRDGLKLPK